MGNAGSQPQSGYPSQNPWTGPAPQAPAKARSGSFLDEYLAKKKTTSLKTPNPFGSNYGYASTPPSQSKSVYQPPTAPQQVYAPNQPVPQANLPTAEPLISNPAPTSSLPLNPSGHIEINDGDTIYIDKEGNIKDPDQKTKDKAKTT